MAEEAMVGGFEHVGMTVSNIAKTVAFYRDLLGMKEIERKVAPSGATVVYLEVRGGGLELVAPPEKIDTPAPQLPAGRAGMRHFSFIVKDLDAAYRKLTAAGVVFTEKPRAARVSSRFSKVAFCNDPDGVSVELMELSR